VGRDELRQSDTGGLTELLVFGHGPHPPADRHPERESEQGKRI